jgi:hypothetical protein
MEQGLIEQLAGYGPWGLALAILALMRKEIAAVITAPKDDRAVEALLAEMNRQFAANMELFHVTNGHLGAVHELLSQSLQVSRRMLEEMLRGGK